MLFLKDNKWLCHIGHISQVINYISKTSMRTQQDYKTNLMGQYNKLSLFYHPGEKQAYFNAFF